MGRDTADNHQGENPRRDHQFGYGERGLASPA
jgi:hypothetical protein